MASKRFDKCERCQEPTDDHTYVTNWGVCDPCFDEMWDKYQRSVQLELPFNEEETTMPDKDRWGYPSNEPCVICGKHSNNQSEPRFSYVVCEDHQKASIAEINRQKP